MIGLLVKAAIAAVLFVASLVGGLAATGRLNHEGTANIPVLRSLFPPPPEPADGGEPDAGDAGGAGAAAGGTAGTDSEAANAHGALADAGAAPSGESRAADGTQAQQPHADDAPRVRKTGRSLNEPPGKPGSAAATDGTDANGDAGHAGEPSAGGAATAAANAAHGDAANGAAAPVPAAARGTPEADFAALQQSLANGRSPYTPGAFFRFDGMPAGLSVEQINEAWQRVQGLMAEIEHRKVALDLQEQQLRELNEDISRRQAALGTERVEIEQMHRELDAKIEKFKEQVKLVRTDEVAALKRNAQTLASFEPTKAAELLEAQWKTEKGQDEVLKLLEFMDKDAVNAILDALPKELTNDLLKKRLRVSKEASAPGKGG
jgi:hypothetical protein